jgi:hypothetical protein
MAKMLAAAWLLFLFGFIGLGFAAVFLLDGRDGAVLVLIGSAACLAVAFALLKRTRGGLP